MHLVRTGSSFGDQWLILIWWNTTDYVLGMVRFKGQGLATKMTRSQYMVIIKTDRQTDRQTCQVPTKMVSSSYAPQSA